MAKLKDPYPSPPGRPGKYVLYLSRRHGDDPMGNQMAVSIWGARYGAKKYLDALLADDGVVWEGEHQIRSESGIVVKSTLLAEVMDHEYSLEEMAWSLPVNTRREAMVFRKHRDPDSVDAPEEKARRRRDGTARAARAPRAPGMVSIGQVAEELGLDPRDCRGVLRKKLTKPAHGWAWSKEDVEAVKTLLRAEVR